MPPPPRGPGWSFRPRIRPWTLRCGVAGAEPVAACLGGGGDPFPAHRRSGHPLRQARSPLPGPGLLCPSAWYPGLSHFRASGAGASRGPLAEVVLGPWRPLQPPPGPGAIDGNLEPFCFLATQAQAKVSSVKTGQWPTLPPALCLKLFASFRAVVHHPFLIQQRLSNSDPAARIALQGLGFA